MGPLPVCRLAVAAPERPGRTGECWANCDGAAVFAWTGTAVDAARVPMRKAKASPARGCTAVVRARCGRIGWRGPGLAAVNGWTAPGRAAAGSTGRGLFAGKPGLDAGPMAPGRRDTMAGWTVAGLAWSGFGRDGGVPAVAGCGSRGWPPGKNPWITRDGPPGR